MILNTLEFSFKNTILTRWRNLFKLVDMSKSCPYRWFLVKREFLKNCQIVWFFVVIFWQSDSWLPGNCQPIVWMVCWWKENCQMKRIIRWKEFRRQELYALAKSWKQEYGCYNISLLGRRLTANLPNRGKHVAHDGQARCPTWASTLPILTQIGY